MGPHWRTLATVLTVLLGTAAARAQAPAGLTNVRLERRPASGGLEKDVRSLLAAQKGPFWIGYTVPANRPRSHCCWNSMEDAGRCCGGCRLEAEKQGAFTTGAGAPVELENRGLLRVLLGWATRGAPAALRC